MSLFKDKKKKPRGRYNDVKVDSMIGKLMRKIERKGKE